MALLNRYKNNVIMRHLPPLLGTILYDKSFSISFTNLWVKSGRKCDLYSISFKWWGEKTETILRPPYQRTDYLVAPCVLTSYLKLCEVLEFTILLLNNGDVVGGAFLHDIARAIQNQRQELQVIDHSGSRIGVLTIEFHVSDELFVKKIKTNRPQPSWKPTIDFGKEGSEKSKFGIAASLAKRRILVRPTYKKVYSRSEPPEKGGNDDAPCLRFSTKLPIDYNSPLAASSEKNNVISPSPLEASKKPSVLLGLPSIIDFLLGKCLTDREQRQALMLLHKMSPNQSFVKKVTENCVSLPHQGVGRQALKKGPASFSHQANACPEVDSIALRYLNLSEALNNYNYNLKDPVELAYCLKFMDREQVTLKR